MFIARFLYQKTDFFSICLRFMWEFHFESIYQLSFLVIIHKWICILELNLYWPHVRKNCPVCAQCYLHPCSNVWYYEQTNPISNFSFSNDNLSILLNNILMNEKYMFRFAWSPLFLVNREYSFLKIHKSQPLKVYRSWIHTKNRYLDKTTNF